MDLMTVFSLPNTERLLRSSGAKQQSLFETRVRETWEVPDGLGTLPSSMRTALIVETDDAYYWSATFYNNIFDLCTDFSDHVSRGRKAYAGGSYSLQGEEFKRIFVVDWENP